MITPSASRLASQKGNTLVEFALIMLLAIPMLFGVVASGITFGRGIQAVQVTRDIGHMYALGVNFTDSSTSLVINKIAQDFNMNASSGNAGLLLSTLYRLDQAACTAASVNPCTNAGSTVFTHRWHLGNSSLVTSALGTPPAQYVSSTNGIISAGNYMTQTSLVATGAVSTITLNPQDSAWVVEGYFTQPDLNFLRPGAANQGSYVRVIF